MTSLCRMARKAGMALWADLHAVGIDLFEVFNGTSPYSAAQALAAAEALPDTSATAAALRGDPTSRGWGTDRELLRLAVNLLMQLLTYVPQWEKQPDLQLVESPLEIAQRERELAERHQAMASNDGILARFAAAQPLT